MDRKQISFYVPTPDWKLIRDEAAQKRVHVTDMIAGWVEGEIRKLREKANRKAKSRTVGKEGGN